MKAKNKYRVLLMCRDCNKVYNGSNFVDYPTAIRIYHSTLLNNKDTCKNCEEPLIAKIQNMEKNNE